MYKLKLNAGRWYRSLKTPIVGESGRVKLKVVLWITGIALTAYMAVVLIPPFASYKMLEYEARGEADVAHMYTDAQIESRLASKAASWSIEIGSGDIDVTRDYEEIDISINYSIIMTFFGRFERVIYFDIEISEPLAQL